MKGEALGEGEVRNQKASHSLQWCSFPGYARESSSFQRGPGVVQRAHSS